MRFHPQNMWFVREEFPRAALAVHAAAGKLRYLEAGMYTCKYVQLYVDQRTGSFIFRTGDGEMLTHGQVYLLYPELRDEVKIVSAGVRPYPE